MTADLPGTPDTSDELDPAFEASHQAAAAYAQIRRRDLDLALQSFAADGWFLTNGTEMRPPGTQPTQETT